MNTPFKNNGLIAILVLISLFLFGCSSSGSNDSANTDAGDSNDSSENGETDDTGNEDTDSSMDSNDNACSVSARVGTNDVPYVGNIFRPSTPNDERFHALWNQVTPENAGKWLDVEPNRDQMNWTVLDAAVNFASSYSYTFKYHTLISGENEPAWMSALTATEQEQEIIEWFDAIATRYPDIQQLEVVNEPISAQPSYIDALGGAGDTGWDWVIKAFELARDRFPNTELILNDYKVSASDNTSDEFLQIVPLLQARNLIDGVGIEGHFLEQTDLAVIEQKLNALAALNIPVYISDLDINEADDQVQLDTMKSMFPLFFDNQAVKGITFWGYRENQLWRQDSFLLSASETDRPALDWLECYLGLDDA